MLIGIPQYSDHFYKIAFPAAFPLLPFSLRSSAIRPQWLAVALQREGGREEDNSSVSNRISEEKLQLKHEQENSHFKNKKSTTLTPSDASWESKKKEVANEQSNCLSSLSTD